MDISKNHKDEKKEEQNGNHRLHPVNSQPNTRDSVINRLYLFVVQFDQSFVRTWIMSGNYHG